MIFSMTGFGRGTAQTPSRIIKIELKSLNSRQLDLSMRVPSYFKETEVYLRGIISETLERGKIDLNMNIESVEAVSNAILNIDVMKAYKDQILEMSEALALPQPNDWYSILLRLPDSVKIENSQADDIDKQACLEACRTAVKELIEFRKEEGIKLYGFFLEKVENISKLLEKIPDFETVRVAKIRERLEQQLSKLNSIEYDKGRLEQELIFYIEKLDVTEEKTRLKAHIDYFIETLGDKTSLPAQGQGKKLGFIAQEMGREINTLGSKSNDADMQKIVVMMKDELEQIKEQVLNVL